MSKDEDASDEGDERFDAICEFIADAKSGDNPVDCFREIRVKFPDITIEEYIDALVTQTSCGILGEADAMMQMVPQGTEASAVRARLVSVLMTAWPELKARRPSVPTTHERRMPSSTRH